MHIYLPAHSYDTVNLKLNTQRLTTPFDVHATLKHVLNGEKKMFSNFNNNKFLPKACPTAASSTECRSSRRLPRAGAAAIFPLQSIGADAENGR
jgi:hypothetical protein